MQLSKLALLALLTFPAGAQYLPCGAVQLLGGMGAPCAVPFSVALVNFASCGTGANSCTSGTINVAAGNLLVACVRGQPSGGSPTLTVSDLGGSTWLYTPGGFYSANNDHFQVAYAYNAVAKTADTVTAQFQAGGSYTSMIVAQFSGILTGSNPLDVSGTGNTGGSGTSLTTGSYTTTSPNELIIACGTWDGVELTATAGSGFTLVGVSSDGSMAMEYQIVSTIQTNQIAGMTLSSASAWIMYPASFE